MLQKITKNSNLLSIYQYILNNSKKKGRKKDRKKGRKEGRKKGRKEGRYDIEIKKILQNYF